MKLWPKLLKHGDDMYKMLAAIAILTLAGPAHAWGKEDASVWARKMQIPNVKNIECADWDTDNNGYVSCSISYVDNGNFKVLAIECPARFSFFTRECRMARATLGN